MLAFERPGALFPHEIPCSKKFVYKQYKDFFTEDICVDTSNGFEVKEQVSGHLLFFKLT